MRIHRLLLTIDYKTSSIYFTNHRRWSVIVELLEKLYNAKLMNHATVREISCTSDASDAPNSDKSYTENGFTLNVPSEFVHRYTNTDKSLIIDVELQSDLMTSEMLSYLNSLINVYAEVNVTPELQNNAYFVVNQGETVNSIKNLVGGDNENSEEVEGQRNIKDEEYKIDNTSQNDDKITNDPTFAANVAKFQKCLIDNLSSKIVHGPNQSLNEDETLVSNVNVGPNQVNDEVKYKDSQNTNSTKVEPPFNIKIPDLSFVKLQPLHKNRHNLNPPQFDFGLTTIHDATPKPTNRFKDTDVKTDETRQHRNERHREYHGTFHDNFKNIDDAANDAVNAAANDATNDAATNPSLPRESVQFHSTEKQNGIVESEIQNYYKTIEKVALLIDLIIQMKVAHPIFPLGIRDLVKKTFKSHHSDLKYDYLCNQVQNKSCVFSIQVQKKLLSTFFYHVAAELTKFSMNNPQVCAKVLQFLGEHFNTLLTLGKEYLFGSHPNLKKCLSMDKGLPYLPTYKLDDLHLPKRDSLPLSGYLNFDRLATSKSLRKRHEKRGFNQTHKLFHRKNENIIAPKPRDFITKSRDFIQVDKFIEVLHYVERGFWKIAKVKDICENQVTLEFTHNSILNSNADIQVDINSARLCPLGTHLSGDHHYQYEDNLRLLNQTYQEHALEEANKPFKPPGFQICTSFNVQFLLTVIMFVILMCKFHTG